MSVAAAAAAAASSASSGDGAGSAADSPPSAVTVSTTIVVGLNAAFQKRFLLPEQDALVPGNVHRATATHEGVGGKGQDVAMALACLQVPCLLAQFVGQGGAGDAVYKLLSGDDSHGFGRYIAQRPCTVRSKAPLRTCTSIVASDTTTELVEPSGQISEGEYQELLDKLKRVAEQEQTPVDALCIMGSMPPGCAPDTYAQIYECVARKSNGGKTAERGDTQQQPPKEQPQQQLLCLIDSVVGWESLLETIAVMATSFEKERHRHTRRSTVLKINASELCRLAMVNKQTSESSGVQKQELIRAIFAFLQQRCPQAKDALDALAITDGAHPAYFVVMPPTKTQHGGAKTERSGNDGQSFHLFEVAVPQIGGAPDNDNDTTSTSNNSANNNNDNDRTPLSMQEQELLTETINELDPEHLGGVIQIIREAAPVGADEDEIDLEIDQLDTATQRKLLQYVSKFLKRSKRQFLAKRTKIASNENNSSNPPPPTKIYPIGAGDAVAAGTLAAWRSLSLALSNGSNSFGSANDDDGTGTAAVLPRPLHDSLIKTVNDNKTGGQSPLSLAERIMLASFQFGIACGTASCLQAENSVVQLADVERFYGQSSPLKFVSSHVLS